MGVAPSILPSGGPGDCYGYPGFMLSLLERDQTPKRQVAPTPVGGFNGVALNSKQHRVAWTDSFLFLSGNVCRVEEIDPPRTRSMDLENCLLFSSVAIHRNARGGL